MAQLPTLVAPPKLITNFRGWSEPEPETGFTWFNAPLEIGGVTEPGFMLTGGCYIDRPDCNVTLEIKIGRRPGRPAVPLERIEWRSLRMGHTNKRRAGHPLSGKRVPATHIHRFEDNWLSNQQRMMDGNLPFAREIDEDLQTFEELIAFARKQFRINNIDVVQKPAWVYKLGLE